jgi:hypothetical protein
VEMSNTVWIADIIDDASTILIFAYKIDFDEFWEVPGEGGLVGFM